MSLREIIQRNEVTSLLLARGYNVYLPMVDDGIDFIALNETTGDLKLVQQKSRWTIARKYVGRGIWIAFRDAGHWYLALHDEMVAHARETSQALVSRSWTERGQYSSARLSRAQRVHYAPMCLDAPLCLPAAEEV